ncbi:flagellar hook-associated protein FlgK [Roseibaca sp. Y0-43]|uniref:flagellar hook-associated protein FlgK n=1 Tax=Roseibaca sp. Y0-43 TaxID=2816854 RepID=UPI001D0C280B|nr:flagellar hook-associated protein FlgK [Roseibaca sp. Y0-43]MCC1482538.1 flagellar hook-associated protein FlgK [Roseibaca sp. Y0-43]
MSLGVANNIALGGLRFTSQGTRVVAENLANADIEGYGLRSTLATGTISGGASTVARNGAVIRDVDPVLLAAVRSADTVRQSAQIETAALSELEQAYGLPGETGSLNDLFSRLDANLHQAATTPDSPAALQAVAQDAERIAAKFNAIGQHIQAMRQQADTAVETDIATLNTQLERVASLNKDIQRQTLLGGTPFALMDERERVISDIATLLPVSEIPRDNNRVMLVTARGEILVDLDAAEFGFTATPGIAADDTRSSGAVSSISLNGRELGLGDRTLAGGKLGANLAVRDTIAPQAQSDLDRLAMDLLTRFAGPDADTSLAAGELGLFTLTSGTSFPADPTGAAQALRITPMIDPADSSSLWRLRSGLNAAMPGPSVDPANLSRMIDALSDPRTLGPGLPALSMAENISETLSRVATKRLGAESALAYAQASYTAKQETLASRGVDTDAQMQDLLELERAYAANARVLTTIDDMLRQLLEI